MTQLAHLAEAMAAPRWHAAAAASGPTDAPASGPPMETGTAATEPPLVLLIDDDAKYRGSLGCYLRANGFAVAECDSFAAALARISSAPRISVIVPEFTVGSRHLFDCIGQFRRVETGAVLVLSNHSDETDTIVALELGADDVMAKSADRRQILARIRAAVRRLREPRAAPVRLPAPGAPAASWRFLPAQRRLLDPQGRPVRLTDAEFALLAALVANVGNELGRDQLSWTVLGRPLGVGDRGIDNLVAKLRRKLGDSAQRMIRTVRSRGYVFTGWQISSQ